MISLYSPKQTKGFSVIFADSSHCKLELNGMIYKIVQLTLSSFPAQKSTCLAVSFTSYKPKHLHQRGILIQITGTSAHEHETHTLGAAVRHDHIHDIF